MVELSLISLLIIDFLVSVYNEVRTTWLEALFPVRNG